MFRILTKDGVLLFAVDDILVARSLLRTQARAHRIETSEGVLLSWRPGKPLDAIADVGRDAGVPREFQLGQWGVA